MLKTVKKKKVLHSDIMEFSLLFLISFLIIPDVPFDVLFTDVHLPDIFRKQSTMTPRSSDSQSLDN